MFTWIADSIRRWRRNKARNVFRFFDGKRTRAVDPFEVYRFFDQHKHFKWDHLKMVDEGDVDAAAITVTAAREVFGLCEYHEQPTDLTAAEVLDIVRDFGNFVESAKKKYDRGSISSPPAAGRPSNVQESPSETISFSSVAS